MTLEGAERRLAVILAAGGGAVLQEWIPGRREAVSLFFADGRIWARLAQVSHREWPILGGGSVLCETIALPQDIVEASEDLVRAMDLEGCSMVEFRPRPRREADLHGDQSTDGRLGRARHLGRRELPAAAR